MALEAESTRSVSTGSGFVSAYLGTSNGPSFSCEMETLVGSAFLVWMRGLNGQLFWLCCGPQPMAMQSFGSRALPYYCILIASPALRPGFLLAPLVAGKELK